MPLLPDWAAEDLHEFWQEKDGRVARRAFILHGFCTHTRVFHIENTTCLKSFTPAVISM